MNKDERYIYFQQDHNKPLNFYANVSMTDSFSLGYAPTKPGPNHIGIFPVGAFKK